MRDDHAGRHPFASSWDAGQHQQGEGRRARGRRERRASHAGPGTVRDALFLPGPVASISPCASRSRATPLIGGDSGLAEALGVALPVSFFEHSGPAAYFNSLAMVDADGQVMGLSASRTFRTGPAIRRNSIFRRATRALGVADEIRRLGCGICWDQWFPEAARAMAMKGAEVLFYPTAIGSEPPPAPPARQPRSLAPRMQGHAAAQ